MPRSPRRGCAVFGCPDLAEEGSPYCSRHRKIMDKQYNKYERAADVNKKYGRVWKRIRDKYAKEHPLCEQCLKEGRVTLMDEVHHIVPISQGGTHDPSNLMSLCQSCHTKIHMEMKDRQIRR